MFIQETMTSSIPAEQSSFVSPLRRLTSRKKQGLRKLKPMRKDTPKLSGGGWFKCALCAGLFYLCCCRSDDDENDS
ncbi:hypothetical protein J3F82_003190 [Coemansia sp. RSA 637]|nr:hypothetical protein J3F82_003190 [Coemansia sp. RSA 637]